MLTPEQEQWVNHLSDETKIKIIPFDPRAENIFNAVATRIYATIGPSTPFHHSGATSLGISGQDEIDTYIPISIENFGEYILKLTELFGQAKKIYPEDRAHFITNQDGKHVDIYLINKDAPSWTNGVIFHDYLKSHPEALERYRILKEDGSGLSVREYYRQKTEFINEILELAQKSPLSNNV